MLKGNLKLLEKKNRDIDEERLHHFKDGWAVTLGAESGEELKTFRSSDVRLDEAKEDHNDDYVDNSIEREEKVAQKKKERINEYKSLSVLWDEKLFGCRKDKGIPKMIPTSSSSVLDDEEKKAKLECELFREVINLDALQRIASSGLPDGGGWRATSWKAELTRKKEKAVVSNKHEREDDADGLLMRHQISHEDHPLSLGKASIWHQYFQDEEIAEQIDRDLQRTQPNMRFFSEDSPMGHKHRKEMRNILLLFAKLNPAIRYVQGMNEVLAPLYYVFSTDPDEQNASNAEADSFACFVRLLSDSLDHFCQQLDNSSVGILSTLARLAEIVKANDEELWQHLETVTKVNPQFYAFRWITLLLTQEFDIYDIMRIWDSLLSNPFGVQEMLLRVCCAMLLCVRSELLKGDFAANLKLLQHYPPINIEYLLQVAQDLSPQSNGIHLSH